MPLALLRRALSDIKVGDVTIPKGSLVAPNLYEMHHNEQDWQQPNTFNPERWIIQDKNGDRKLINYTPKSYLPFGIGLILYYKTFHKYYAYYYILINLLQQMLFYMSLLNVS